MKKIAIFLTICIALFANDNTLVKITQDTPYLYVKHNGVKVKVARIQDVDNRLNDDYTKTSRECPPFCIHPTKVDNGIETIGEVEFINYMKQDNALIIDSRLKSWYELETIPSAVNIPYTVLENSSQDVAIKLFSAIGMKLNQSKKMDFSNTKVLVIFDNGIWCDQATRLIKEMIKYNYPKSKIKYYRSGFQGWKLLSLTTIIQKENKK